MLTLACYTPMVRWSYLLTYLTLVLSLCLSFFHTWICIVGPANLNLISNFLSPKQLRVPLFGTSTLRNHLKFVVLSLSAFSNDNRVSRLSFASDFLSICLLSTESGIFNIVSLTISGWEKKEETDHISNTTISVILLALLSISWVVLGRSDTLQPCI